MTLIKPENPRIAYVKSNGEAITAIRTRFKELPAIGLRGISTPIGEALHFTTEDPWTLKNIEDTLIDGTELEETAEETRLVHDYPSEGLRIDPSFVRVSRVMDYSDPFLVELFLEGSKDSQMEKDIVRRAILAYDVDKMKHIGGHGGYSYQLPKNKEDRSRIILAAYVIDVEPTLMFVKS